MKTAGKENLGRQKAALRREQIAMDELRKLGLQGATIDRLHLGLKQPYTPRGSNREVRNALSYPLLSKRGEALGRYAYLNLANVTLNPLHPRAWGPGSCSEYRIGLGSETALVGVDMLDLWLAWQTYSPAVTDVTFISRTAWGDWPAEWRTPGHWHGYGEIIVLPGMGCSDFMAEIAPLIGREVLLAACPPPSSSFGDMVRAGRVPEWAKFKETSLPAILKADSEDDAFQAVELGMFEAEPIDVSGGYCDGHLYYPVSVELRAVENGGGSVLHRYRTMVVRSDGSMLAADLLPAPRGTDASMRVLALSDGTRIRGLPVASSAGTWSFNGIADFVAWRRRTGPLPFRDLKVLVSDVEAYIRSRVWFKDTSVYAGVAAFVAMTFVHQVFDALPILLAFGPAATGKSEAGEAISRLSFNSVLAGQLRAASMVRLLDETHGLLVLDDMDGLGPVSLDGDGEIAMALKQGYKRSTSRKPVADRGGRITMVDFFGPKMVTRTRRPTPVLGSRMLCLPTDAIPPGASLSAARRTDAELDHLRDEFHAWGMSVAREMRSLYENTRAEVDRREEEIAAPLRTIASFADADFARRLEVYLTGSARAHLRRSDA